MPSMRGGFSNRFFTPLGGIGVAIFLFLSGYGLNESFKTKGLNDFWKNKLTRIVLPYVIWSIIFIPVSYFLYNSVEYAIRYWYIEYMFFWYTLFWITKKYAPLNAEKILLAVAIFSFFIFSNIRAEQSMSFVAGVFVSNNKDSYRKYNSSQYFLVAIILLFIGITSLGLKQLDFIRNFGEESVIVKICQLGIKLPIGLSIIIYYLLFHSILRFEKYLGFMGVMSLEIYLVQMPLYAYISSSVKNLIIVIVLLIPLVLILNFVAEKISHKLATIQ